MRIDVKEELFCSRSSRLKGKKVLILCTGSVSLFKTPEIIRELIREGADVHVMLSQNASKLVTSSVFEWASGNKVIEDITGNVEHVLFAGEHSEKVDLVIIVPLTATTLGKIIHGKADTNVSLTAMTAIGSKIPILVVPGMHRPMHENPFVQENIEQLKKLPTITYIEPRMEEGKAKVAEIHTIINWAIRLLSDQKLTGKSVLVTGGATKEYIDHVRYLTNPSTGKMGYALALEAFYLGAHVEFIVGGNNLSNLDLFNTTQINSVEEMAKEVLRVIEKKNIDLAIFSAAVSDYTPEKFMDSKISSGQDDLSIKLKPTPKILKIVREFKSKNQRENLIVVGFKAEYNKTAEELATISRNYITDGRANIMVANLIGRKESGFGVDKSEVHIIDQMGATRIKGTKQEIAFEILKKVL